MARIGHHPTVTSVQASTQSKKYISVWPILIKFHVKHHQIERQAALSFGTLVAMSTYSSHRLIMGKTLKIFSETMRPTAYIQL